MEFLEVKRTDRRQDNIFVDNDRRSGFDRREKKRDSIFVAFESIPTVRRLYPIPEKVEKGDILPALGMAGLAAINLPEDMRDIGGAIRQLKGEKPLYDYKNYQHSFSFFRGTAIEEWLHKHVDLGKKWANWLYRNDLTLADTTIGEKIINLVRANEQDLIKTRIKDYKGMDVRAIEYGGSKLAQLTGRALRRTTLLGVIVLGLLELPKIFKSKGKIKQTAKSAINLTSITAGIGYGGAIGAKYGGSTGSLIGMGFGAILSNKLSEKAQQLF